MFKGINVLVAIAQKVDYKCQLKWGVLKTKKIFKYKSFVLVENQNNFLCTNFTYSPNFLK